MAKLVLDDVFEDEEYALLAIHTSLEGYKLAFWINKNLKMSLKKARHELEPGMEGARFPVYKYEDEQDGTQYFLVENTAVLQSPDKLISGGMFTGGETVRHLVPELKKADFLMKIVSDRSAYFKTATATAIRRIPGVVAAYGVAPDTLKTKLVIW